MSLFPAKGKKNKGCPKAACTKEKHGCCADGVTPAHGPDQLGCCINTEFGCCPDNMTPAKGANHDGKRERLHRYSGAPPSRRA